MKNTILIVDDVQLCQEMLKSIVVRLGFEAQICEDGDHAIHYLAEHANSVMAVFLDIYMPQVDGISALGHFRSHYPDLPVIVITASDDEADERVVNELGATGFVKKSFSREDIENILHNLLEKSGTAAKAVKR